MTPILGGPISAFAVLLIAAVVVPFLAERLRLPKIAALPFAGLLLGPGALALVQPEAGSQIGTLGMYFLFFATGASIDLAAISRHPSRIAVAASSFALVPLALGASWSAAVFALSGPGIAFLLPALAAGIAFMSSGSSMKAQAIRLGFGRDKATAVAAGGTDLARVSAVALLGILTLLGNPGEAGERVFHAAASMAFLVAVLFLLPPLVSLIFRKTRLDGGTEVVFLLSLAALGAWLAHLAGIGPESGAFAIGLALGGFIPDDSQTAGRMKFVGESFIVPVFLVWFGASLDIAEIASNPLLTVFAASGTAFVAIASRYLAARLASSVRGGEATDAGLLHALSCTFDPFTLALVAAASFAFGLPAWIPLGFLVAGGVSEAIAQHILHRGARADSVRKSVAGASPAIPAIHAGRILVAISKPESAHSLMDLAFLIRDRESRDPVFPLAVVSETLEGRGGFARAEDMLASALVQSVSSSVPVVPVTRMAMNISKGILQAAMEQNTDSIIIGWNKPPKLANAFFGSVIEQVVTGCGLLTIVARLPSDLTSIRQLIIVVPPTSETHTGFSPALAALRNLASSLQARTMLITLKPHGAGLSAAFAETGRFGGIQTVEVAEWRGIGEATRTSGTDSSRMFVLLSARPGELSWHPAVERLPHLLGEDFPDSSLLMAYLPSDQASAGSASPLWRKEFPVEDAASARPAACSDSGADLLREAVAGGRVLTSMRETVVADGIRTIMAAAFPRNRKLAATLSGTFTEIAQRSPIELQQGVVLLHARVPGIESPVISFGARALGFRLSALESPVKVLVLICVPESQSPESHLAVLGEIAKLFMECDLAARLQVAEDAKALLGGL